MTRRTVGAVTSVLVVAVLASGCVDDSAAPTSDGAGTPTAAPATVDTATDGPTTDAAVPDPDDRGVPDAPITTRRAEPSGGTAGTWVDVTAAHGLVAPLTGMRGHAAAWGEVDGDGEPDLVVGTFANRPPETYAVRGASGPSPDRLILSGSDGAVDLGAGRTSGAVFTDLDGDHDDDLVLARNVKDPQLDGAVTTVFENVDGRLVAIVDSGLDGSLGGRSVGVLDHDGDGLSDLFVVEDRYAGGSSRLFRNQGDFRFTDVTAEAGLPDDLEGLGVATVDLDGDHRPDLFVAGSNRLFRNTGDGFAEVDGAVFAWDTFGDEDLVAGVATGDVDRDGRLDLVVGHHFNSTVDDGREVPVRLYLNRSTPGELRFDDVTDAAGLVGLPTKAPHVEIVDVDNDAWPDILTSASAGNGTVPAVFRHRGVVDGVPRFEAPDGLGSPQYWVTAPTVDLDDDLRLDVLAVEWEPTLPSILFRNEHTAGGAVLVEFRGVPAVGATVTVLGPDGSILGFREVVASVGYTAGIRSTAHVGIGDASAVDVQVRLADGRTRTVDDVEPGTVVTIGPDA